MADYSQGQGVSAQGVIGPVPMSLIDGEAQPVPPAGQPHLAGTGDVATPSAHTAATLSYGAVTDVSHILAGLYWSIVGSGTITSAGVTLSITDGSNVVFSADVSAQGPGSIIFDPPRSFTAGNALTVTLADPGANLTAKLNANHWLLPRAIAGSQVGGFDLSQPYNSIFL